MLFREKFKIDSNRLQNWNYSSEAVYFITIVTKNRQSIFGVIEDEKMILNEKGKIIERELLKSIKIRKNWFFHNWVIMPNHVHLLIEIQDTQQMVETHCSASTSSISTTENNISDISLQTYGRETHCSAPLQNQSEQKFESDKNFIHSKSTTQHIVETHCSASTPSISSTENNITEKSLSTYGRETHCSASLQNQSDSKNGSDENLIQNQLSSKLSRKSNSISSFVAIFKSITTKQINGAESIWQANYHDHIVRNYKTFEKIYDYIKHNSISWETDSLK
ncbi:MAG: transposase [Flavobacterium nitrogenifigens]|uniref:transposase n=1 Tax=Flavobacterium nitrogenifigens TaxID=1617283 RepID=UPI0028093E74|nr:transposase [Flavobacterium nitrogenifigens]MDQ8014686.1 transposase [Flavobacterium nitrogenifigens]